ncbi:hypothetical protein [Nocardioides sp. KR10-350]|uniref:hypothetical protein n=1 Tax=Nocardioides cheoyonin TaxID=3156615 RepID=UPI0032B5FBDB
MIADADAHHARSSSPAGRADMRRDAAEMLVGHLLLPVPGHRRVTPVSEANARRCLAVLGGEFLSRAWQDGFDSIAFSEPEMAYSLGTSKGGARGLLATCKRAGWVTSPPSRRGAPSRWRLRHLSDDQKALLWALNYSSFVDALAQGDPSNGFVEVFFSADHAAFGYGHLVKESKPVDASLGHRMWLTAIAAEVAPHPVGVSPEVLAEVGRGRSMPAVVQLWLAEVGAVLHMMGVSPNSARSLMRRWLSIIAGSNEDPMTAALDDFAASTGADVEMAQARALRDADVAERLASRDRRRAEVQHRQATKPRWSAAALAPLLARHPVPSPDTERSVRTAWGLRISEGLGPDVIPAGKDADVVRWLAARMVDSGYARPQARTVSRKIVEKAMSAREAA